MLVGNEPSWPFENVIAKGTPTWPNRNTPFGALLKGGLGTSSAPRVIIDGDAPGGIHIQNWVKPNFTGDPHAQWSSGGIIDTVVCGGIGGATGMDFYISKKGTPADYSGRVTAIGIRSIADGRFSTHTNGILTGIWGGAYSYMDKIANEITTAQENNTFTMYKWDPATEYMDDPFVHRAGQVTCGLLINNYQIALDTLKIGNNGDYQNTFGIAVTSLSSPGRAYGYQTGLYLSDCSQEAIRIKSNAFGTGQVKYGIKLDGKCSSAGIAIGDNKINWGGYSGVLSANGDMLYNNVTGVLYMMDNQGQKEVLKTPSMPIAISTSKINYKVKVNINGKDYYLLASDS